MQKHVRKTLQAWCLSTFFFFWLGCLKCQHIWFSKIFKWILDKKNVIFDTKFMHIWKWWVYAIGVYANSCWHHSTHQIYSIAKCTKKYTLWCYHIYNIIVFLVAYALWGHTNSFKYSTFCLPLDGHFLCWKLKML